MKLDKISEGAESHVYSVNFLGIDCILKRRSKKKYRIKEIDENIRCQRTRNEARIIGTVSSLGIDSPNLLLVDKYDIYMSRINGKNLNDILKSDKPGRLGKTFVALGKYASILHNNNIIHGDYTPANVMIEKDGTVYIIDFGLSSITNSVEDKALDLLLMKRSVKTNLFNTFIRNYLANCTDGRIIKNRLDEIEKRGRYNTRTILTT
jgi:Kae1-associated kinase Bud32